MISYDRRRLSWLTKNRESFWSSLEGSEVISMTEAELPGNLAMPARN